MGAPSHVRPGDVLGGKYRVERVLGTGGMGMVVAARHVQLGQRVALKLMLKAATSDPESAERFAREARSAVRLQSAHTARVSDVGKLKNGEPFMVMEYLDGLDLDEVLHRNGALPPHLAVDYILQACEAFAEAHGLGMVHRDIKLKNLFLSQTVAGAPIVKVLDFGLAKTIGSAQDVSLTGTQAVFGSPQYMSPEQMRSAKDVDARSDIWSIGICLYELLTTRVPFDAAGVAEICAMVLKDPVEPPSTWSPALPAELGAVIMKCLEKDPALRYQTVAELAFALEPWAVVKGSARRIHDVMEMVKQSGSSTMAIDEPSDANDGPKTLDAWDSGEKLRPTSRIPRTYWIGGGLASLALAGFILIGVALMTRQAQNASAGSAAESITSAPIVLPDPASPTAAAPPPPAEATTASATAAPAGEPPVASDPPPLPVPAVAAMVTKPVAPAVASPVVKTPVRPITPVVPRATALTKPPPAPPPSSKVQTKDRF